jgi:hypothetical protein
LAGLFCFFIAMMGGWAKLVEFCAAGWAKFGQEGGLM